MKAEFFQIFGQERCFLLIEEINITKEEDKKRASDYTEKNLHLEACIVASGYAKNELFIKLVDRWAELEQKYFEMTSQDTLERGEIIRFIGGHFRINLNI